MKHYQDIDDPNRPVIGLADEYPTGFTDPFHSHERAQLLYASSGIMSVEAASASFVVPPQRALWIPRGVVHQVSCRCAVSLRTLYFSEERRSETGSCKILEVSDFLRALILEVVKFDPLSAHGEREGAIINLLVNEIADMPAAPYHIPMPSDRRILSVCRELLKNPTDKRDLDEWAAFAGLGRRTFTRLFRAETGMGLATWRQQARLLEALSRLAAGQTVTSVAYEVGYESPSAFTAMFHKSFGVPPSQYRFVESG
jgi:AraC-like DNA-binding protein